MMAAAMTTSVMMTAAALVRGIEVWRPIPRPMIPTTSLVGSSMVSSAMEVMVVPMVEMPRFFALGLKTFRGIRRGIFFAILGC